MIILRLNLRNSSMGFNSKGSPFCFVSWYFYCLNFKAINISILNVNQLFVTETFENAAGHWSGILFTNGVCLCHWQKYFRISSFHNFVFLLFFTFFIYPGHLAQRQITNFMLLVSYFRRFLLRTFTVDRYNCSKSETPILLTSNNLLNETDENCPKNRLLLDLF